jgi:arylsulfatase A-like enzyme
LNSTYQRNKDAPISYEGFHTVDVLAEKALGLLDEAAGSGQPFFLGLAPVAPHSNVDASIIIGSRPPDVDQAKFGAPMPAERHKHLFSDVKIPRTENFNPDQPSGANWMLKLPKQNREIVDFNDDFYRNRLRTLQSVDELVDSVVAQLEELGILDSTYIIYTTDNGYHIGQHRMPPGKECGFEEDINIPLIIRGPGVPKDFVTEIVTTHTDLAPTILDLVESKVSEQVQFDGEAIPLSADGLLEAEASRHEHVNVEFWGVAIGEGGPLSGYKNRFENNTYKALRVVSKEWDLYYSVWCTNEHELYDLKVRTPVQYPRLIY